MDGQTTFVVMRDVAVLLVCAAAAAAAISWIRVPQAVAFLVGGLAAGSLAPGIAGAATPDTLLVVLLPGLVFAAATRLPMRDLLGAAGTIGVLAVPGVVVTAGIVGALVSFGVGLRPELGFVFGAIVSATDPAAVVATFDRLGAPRRLTSIIEAESLFNDGTGIALFAVAVAAATSLFDPAAAVVSFALVLTISSFIGIASGTLTGLIAARTDSVALALGLSLVAAYGGSGIAARLGDSGLLAAVTAGVAFGVTTRVGPTPRATRAVIDSVWRTIETVLSATTFLAVGAVSAVAMVGAGIGPIAWGVAAVVLARIVLVFGIVGAGRLVLSGRRRPAMPAAWLPPLFWAGLRGGVATAAALSLAVDLPERTRIVQMTLGVVLVTLLAQGTTAGWVLRRAGLVQPDPGYPESTLRIT